MCVKQLALAVVVLIMLSSVVTAQETTTTPAPAELTKFEIMAVLLCIFAISVVALVIRRITVMGMAIMLNIAIAALFLQEQITAFAIIFSCLIALVYYFSR